MADDKNANNLRRPRVFETTCWSVIRAAGRAGTPESRRAWATLCVRYQRPIYDFIRYRWSEEEARDLTQGFFARLLEKEDIACVDPSVGKFRNWLLKAVQSYCINEWQRARAEKRGGKSPHQPIDDPDLEGGGPTPPALAHDRTPERIYERGWALTLLSQALHALRDEHVKRDQLALFEKLQLCLIGWNEERHEKIARELGMPSVNAFNVKVNRFKGRFRALLRSEIAQTVSTEDEIEEELRHLFLVLQSR